MKNFFFIIVFMAINLLFVQCETGLSNTNSTIHYGQEYVDLGLSVKWATCNVGAKTPEQYGKYFAWGEVVAKDEYSWSSYKYHSTDFTKYNATDKKTTLFPSDDAAFENWGGNWRMPTKIELDELCKNCIWTWTTQNGVNGYKVTSKIKGYTDKSIFLPAAGGYTNVVTVDNIDVNGIYWSSTLDDYYFSAASTLAFDSDTVIVSVSNRHQGFSVRPVCK